MICKSIAPTQDGSRSLFSHKSTSVTSKKQIDVLMLMQTKMLKVRKSLSIEDTMVPIKDGKFFILTQRKRLRQRDSMKNLDSISIDHSTWSQNFHSIELLNVLEPTMLSSRDGERMLLNNNSTLMRFQRPLDPRHGRTMACKSNPTVDHQTSDSHLLSNLDGGNCSDLLKVPLSQMKKERSWKSQVDLIMRTKTLLSPTRVVRSIRDGRSFMLTSIPMNQRKVNSMRNSVYMLIEISILYLHWMIIDI
jgi:hypothetical protein